MSTLRNRYHLVRHGHSLANEQGLIISRLPAPGLRERDFGELEGGSHEEYAAVWAGDAVSAANRAGGTGESVANVADRAEAVILQLERDHEDRDVVLVGHGDSISILSARLLGPSLEQHRRYGLANCGILRIPPA